ncbi:hypothetical protein AKJ09_05280 [Labilithrix luteola]|uniref:Uncharacterized protein n=1 Tax=Labilithrix luteola TaxID=1391654 RepID=A0A0K1PYY3_9BACT|nr:hypothetical protein [Labilithrix luteola]AKU98616.1 hypothetical protein AKJ09_05280 [Labilithrix luteola]
MTELSPKARALLSRTASGFEPTQADRDRLRSALRARMLAGAATAAVVPAAVNAASSTAPPAAAGTTTVLAAAKAGGVVSKLALVKIGAALLVVGAAATTTAVLSTHDGADVPRAPSNLASPTATTAPPPAPGDAKAVWESAPETAPIEVATASSQDVSPPPRAATVAVPVAARSVSPRVEAVPSAVRPARADEAFDAEMAVMREVQVALRSHDAARALAALDAHDARFGGGALAEERAAARVIALCDLGRQAEASAARSAFLASFPRSLQAERVRRACASSETNGAPRD